MAFWLLLFLFVSTTVVSALLQKKPKDAQPAGKGDFQVPTAEEGRVIPVVYGTVLNAGPNVVWWGDLNIGGIKKKSGGFLGIGAKSVTVGYRYKVGMQMVLSHGFIDEVIGIRVGTKDLPIEDNGPGNETGRSLVINANSLFGGDNKEGGIQGLVNFYYGSDTQDPDAYLSTQFGETSPAYRGLSYAVLRKVYVGTSQYIKNWAFILRRCPNGLGLGGGLENINGDANPACIIYDMMTNARYGLGTADARFDLDSFVEVATTLAIEEMGMSILVDNSASADALISDICRHCDLVLYTDPATALWTLKAVRADYDVGDLPRFTEDDILEAPEMTRPSFPDLLNEIKVEYLDRATDFKPRLAPAQDLAVFSQQGELRSETLTFHGFSNPAIANRVAFRELKTHSYPLAQVKLKLNRKAWALRPGGVFVIDYAPDGITGMALRVAEINYGALDDTDLAIEVTAIEDIFAISGTAYDPPPASGWENPITPPQPVAAQALLESPYHLVGENRFVIDLASRADTYSASADVYSDDGSGWQQTADLTPFTPSGTLQDPYLATTDAFDLTGFIVDLGGHDLSELESTDNEGLSRGDNLLLIDQEICSWKTVVPQVDGTYLISGIVRGVMDTFPADHAAGARVWFMSDGSTTTDSVPYDVDFNPVALQVRNQPVNPLGVLDPGSALTMPIFTDSRAWKPYPPGLVEVNGVPGEQMQAVGPADLVLSWVHRNRLWQKANSHLTHQDDPSDPTGAEGTYSVKGVVGLLPRFFVFETGDLESRFTEVYADTHDTIYIRGLGQSQRFWSEAVDNIVDWDPYEWLPGALPEYQPTITLTGGTTHFDATPYGHYEVGIDVDAGEIKTFAVGAVTWPDSISIIPAPSARPSNWIPLLEYDYTFVDISDPIPPVPNQLGRLKNMHDLREATTVLNVTGLTGVSQALPHSTIAPALDYSTLPIWFEISQVAGSYTSIVRKTAPVWATATAGYGENYGEDYGG